MNQREIVAATTLLAVVFVAGIVHIASLLLVPRVAPADAFARLAAVAPEGSVSVLPRGGSPEAVLPDRDPSMATAVCRYDLDRGPLRVSATLDDEAFVALTLHARSGVAFYGLNDRAGNDGKLELVVMTAGQLDEAQSKDAPDAPVRDVRVVAPQRQGFVMFDVLPRIGGQAEARRALSSTSCRVEHPL
jgi:uncharacterized membrane protein